MRGQLFNDRAYTIKVMSVVALPKEISATVIARYQDGQPFARVEQTPIDLLFDTYNLLNMSNHLGVRFLF